MPYELTNETSIYHDTTTGAYMVKLWTTNERTGKRQKITLPGRNDPPIKTKAEAIAIRDATKERLQGEPEPRPEKRNFGDYALDWFELHKTWIKPSTRRTYHASLRDWIIPTLGDIYCEAFNRQDLLRWVGWAEAQTQEDGSAYAQQSLDGHRRVLWKLVKDMAADFGIADPTRRVRPPKSKVKRVRDKETLTLEELHAFVLSMREVCPSRWAETAELAYTGIRTGELWALHTDQLEDEGKSAHICRSVSAGVIQDTTKTGWERHVWRPEIVREASHEHRVDMLRTQHRGLHSGLLYPSDAGTPRTSASLTKAFAKAREHAGIDKHVSARVLRRTFNTILREANVADETVLSQMGHASKDMGLYYFEGHLEAKAKALVDAFEIPA